MGEASIPAPPDRERKGPAYRKGNVEGKDFMEAFGFRGVEFGNWNNQDDRRVLLNNAYDGKDKHNLVTAERLMFLGAVYREFSGEHYSCAIIIRDTSSLRTLS